MTVPTQTPIPEPPAGEDMQLSTVLQAMADQNRLRMLVVLLDGEWHPSGPETWGLGLQKSTVSHHLRTLREAGVVECRHRGRNRDARLRRDVLDAQFPGLLDGVLRSA